MYAIQWYDPYMPESQLPYKDGAPKGRFATREDAEEKASELSDLADGIPYEIVEIK